MRRVLRHANMRVELPEMKRFIGRFIFRCRFVPVRPLELFIVRSCTTVPACYRGRLVSALAVCTGVAVWNPLLL